MLKMLKTLYKNWINYKVKLVADIINDRFEEKPDIYKSIHDAKEVYALLKGDLLSILSYGDVQTPLNLATLKVAYDVFLNKHMDSTNLTERLIKRIGKDVGVFLSKDECMRVKDALDPSVRDALTSAERIVMTDEEFEKVKLKVSLILNGEVKCAA